MKHLRNYLLVLTLMLATFTFAACGNNEDETTTAESATENGVNDNTTDNMDNNGNAGNVNDTTNNGVVDDIGDDIEDGVSAVSYTHLRAHET